MSPGETATTPKLVSVAVSGVVICVVIQVSVVVTVIVAVPVVVEVAVQGFFHTSDVPSAARTDGCEVVSHAVPILLSVPAQGIFPLPGVVVQIAVAGMVVPRFVPVVEPVIVASGNT